MDKPVIEKTIAGFAPPPLSEREKNAIIGGVLLSMLLAALDQTIVAPAMPTIAGALGHAEYLQWIVTGYLLTATAMAPLYGRISDIYGRRPTIYAAVLIFLAGSLISAMAPNMLVLVIGRAVQGLGGGGLFTLTQTVIGDLVPPFERARYAAWIAGTWAVASIAGPLLSLSAALTSTDVLPIGARDSPLRIGGRSGQVVPTRIGGSAENADKGRVGDSAGRVSVSRVGGISGEAEQGRIGGGQQTVIARKIGS